MSEHKINVDGTLYNITKGYSNIDGELREITKGYSNINGELREINFNTVEVGTYWLFDDTTVEQTWTVPATGQYYIELHGAGGSGGNAAYASNSRGVGMASGGGGAGSGESWSEVLAASVMFLINIGAGALGKAGESTSMIAPNDGYTYTCAGGAIGGDGTVAAIPNQAPIPRRGAGGSANTTLGLSGNNGSSAQSTAYTLSGGVGGGNGTSITLPDLAAYGHGGSGGDAVVGGGTLAPTPGNSGCVYICYMGPSTES